MRFPVSRTMKYRRCTPPLATTKAHSVAPQRGTTFQPTASPTGAQIKVRALVTERVGPGTSFIPFHFAGWWQGKDLLDKYPEGAAPIVRGEAVNTATTYGYDSVTMMQETKTTLCNIERA